MKPNIIELKEHDNTMNETDELVYVRVYEELNIFIDKKFRKRDFERSIYRGTTVKALIEDLGIPHTEVDLILVNGVSRPLSHRLKKGDRVSVYPVFETLDITKVTRVRTGALREPKFILDVHLGKLTIYMRMLGFDSEYFNNITDDDLILLALKQNRIILTRDRGILKRRVVTHGYYIRSKNPFEQLKEVIKRFSLENLTDPFSRCLKCNTILLDINDKSTIKNLVPEHIYNTYCHFKQCSKCNRIYWRGSHWENMKKILKSLDLPF